MYTFVLVLDSSEAFNSAVKALNTLGPVQNVRDSRYELRPKASGSWIALTRDQAVKNDYEPGEMSKVTSYIREPIFAVVEVKLEERNLADEFVMSLNKIKNAVIDNDHGLIVPVRTIQDLISQNSNWMYATQLGHSAPG